MALLWMDAGLGETVRPPIVLRLPYALSGSIRLSVLRYAMSGTNKGLPYRTTALLCAVRIAMRRPVLTDSMLLPGPRRTHRRLCPLPPNALSSSDILQAATAVLKCSMLLPGALLSR
eukprot:419073-Rhodomonas_salina.1